MVIPGGGSAGPDRVVHLHDLRVGELLAEGGEGRVFELPLQPHLVVKCYRRPAPRRFLDDVVSWPAQIADPALARRIEVSTAWPTATVVDDDAPTAATTAGAGVLLPRAPRRFAVRHRDGTTRLATLSYLTVDPGHRAVAYGLSLPAPMSSERLGLIYALARVLEAFDTEALSIGHGDLSAKNVLWSLQRGPEVFLLDCDNCERFEGDGRLPSATGRRRAMTPNWDDPGIRAGGNPTLASDRYSLALIFLRLVGAANFPIQARQRQGGPVVVDFEVPSGRVGEALLAPDAPLWDLCERGLSVSDPRGRPPASAWVAALEALLDSLGAASVMRAVWVAQGGGSPAVPIGLGPAASAKDVEIRPVPASPRSRPRWTHVRPEGDPAYGTAPRPAGAAPTAFRPVTPRAGSAVTGVGVWSTTIPPTTNLATTMPPGGGPAPGGGPLAPTPAVSAQAMAYLAQALAWWTARHRAMLRALWRSGQRSEGVRRLAVCALIDTGAALVGLFVVAMMVAPVLGI